MTSHNRFSFFAVFAIAIVLSTLTARAAGELDPTFGASAYGDVLAQGGLYVSKRQPDGKILVGGEFTAIQGYAASALARLNADGSIDTSFNGPEFYGTFGVGGTVRAIALQPDGKILVGGHILGVSGIDSKAGIRRLNPDGSLDSSFTVYQLPPVGNLDVYDIELQPDGKILVGGKFREPSANLLRLNADGTLDNTFQNTALTNTTTIHDVDVLPDGKIIAGGIVGHGPEDPLLVKFNSDGSADSGFTMIDSGGTAIYTVEAQADGKIFVGGAFADLEGVSRSNIARVNANGTLDVTFNPVVSSYVWEMATLPDGKIILSGGFATYNGTPRSTLARINADGSLDITYQDNGIAAAGSDIELLPDGSILAVGSTTNPAHLYLQRVNADGTHNPSLAVRPTRLGMVFRVLQQPDGKVLASGQFLFAREQVRQSLVRFNADGTLDNTFVPYFNDVVGGVPIIYALALQPDGKILIGTVGGMILKRLNSDGSLDASLTNPFGSGTINDIDVQADGKIIIAGNAAIGFRRLNSNGSIDASFAVQQPQGEVMTTVLQPDGQILIGGLFTHVGPIAQRGRVARLNGSDGSLDASFNPDEGANGTVQALAVQPDGKVLVGGNFTALNTNPNIKRIGRLNADGSLDASFIQAPNAAVRAVVPQPGGKVLIAGEFFVMGDGSIHRGIARLNSNGSVDPSFNTSASGAVYDMTPQTDGKILIGGFFGKVNGSSALRIARLLNTRAQPQKYFDYDGDDKADVSVFRPSENKWYVFRSSDSVIYQPVFATAGDIPVPADYDGDQKTDVAIFRPSSADWWYLATSDGTQRSVHWGATGDIARPSDFDGDGKADFIVFRPGENNWYRLGSTGVFSAVNFGLAGDKPVTGDFDGDRKTDVAIYRPSTGDWWWQSSIDGIQRATHWGISSDVPTAADFDGDGVTDFAVYRPSNGVWYIRNSSNGSFTITAFGLAEDKPVAADYDGDGRADIAVFRPSTGVWYLQRSTSGFMAMQFGVSTDIPTPNAFVP